MENKEDDIEDLFRERFENDEASVSPRVWQNIKKNLPEDKDAPGFVFSQNVVLWSIIVLLTVSVVTGTYYHFSKEQLLSDLSVTNNMSHEANRNKSSISDSLTTVHFEKTGTKHFTNDSTELIQPNYLKENQNILSNKSISNKENNKTSNSFVNATDRSNRYGANASKDRKIQSSRTSNSRSVVESKKDNYIKIKSNSLHVFARSDASVSKQKSKHENVIISKADQHSKEKTTILNTRDHDDLTQKIKTINNSEVINLSSIKTNPTQQPSDTSLDAVYHGAIIPPTIDSVSDTIESKNRSFATLSNSLASEDSVNNTMENKTSYVSLASNQAVASDSSTKPTKNHVLKDSLTKADLTIIADHQDKSDSTHFNNNTLSQDFLVSSSFKRDSLLVLLDSTQNTKADSVLAETNTKKEKSKLLSRISIDLVAAALMTGTSTKGIDSLHKSAVAEKNKNDKNSLGYSIGLMVNYQLSDRFRVSTGIVYNTFSEQYNFNYILKKDQSVYIDSVLQNIQVDSINRDIKAKDQYSFLSIPLQVSYIFFVREKIKLSATAGIRSNILLKGVTYLPNAAKTNVVETKSGFNSISFTYLLALEAAYHLNEHSALLLQPVFMYGASSIHNKASGLNQKPYGLGLTLGLRFTF